MSRPTEIEHLVGDGPRAASAASRPAGLRRRGARAARRGDRRGRDACVSDRCRCGDEAVARVELHAAGRRPPRDGPAPRSFRMPRRIRGEERLPTVGADRPVFLTSSARVNSPSCAMAAASTRSRLRRRTCAASRAASTWAAVCLSKRTAESPPGTSFTSVAAVFKRFARALAIAAPRTRFQAAGRISRLSSSR